MEKIIKHIIYRTTDVTTGEYYIGLHKWNTAKSINYFGSFWGHWNPNKNNLIRETLAEYPDRSSARRAEPHWIAPHLGDPLCKNMYARELKEEQDRCDKTAWNKGKTNIYSRETLEKLRQSIIKANKGRPQSEEHRKKISESRLGIAPWNKGKSQPQSKVKCPHCGTIGGIMPMHRWHFDNCKKR